MKKFAIIRLNDPSFGAGPGKVIELTDDPPHIALTRYEDRDGSRSEKLRCWKSLPGLQVGDLVSLNCGQTQAHPSEAPKSIPGMDTLTTTPERLAQVRQYIQDRRTHAAKVIAIAQNVERGYLPVKPEDREATAQELRAEAATADAVASAVESALLVLF